MRHATEIGPIDGRVEEELTLIKVFSLGHATLIGYGIGPHYISLTSFMSISLIRTVI